MFVGHLDFMRALQKIFRRARIPIAYSQGFNPHQIFSIAAPLPVGTTSQAEYLDMQLVPELNSENFEAEKIIADINAVSIPEIYFQKARILAEKETSAMAACQSARYQITFSESLQSVLGNQLQPFLDQSEIWHQKKNKKGKWNEIDLKPGIYDYQVTQDGICLLLATGSVFNIKPDLWLKALFSFSNLMLSEFTTEMYYRIERLELYQDDKGEQTL